MASGAVDGGGGGGGYIAANVAVVGNENERSRSCYDYY